ncbi:hypothetical protein ACPESR_03295 [Nocardia testacea]|uniref:hypothetical protein n=1 Tax=Nocardia testacea TaxID=248551 RepID=UPI003C2F0D1F
MTEIPALPFRAPKNRAMAATLKLLHAGTRWVADDPKILRQIADGLRGMDQPTTHCRSQAPIRGYAHAHQVMATHAEHRCPRFETAVEFAARVCP